MIWPLLLLALARPVHVETVRASMYHPGDGHNAGELACGGRFEAHQEHVAVRRWWAVGCGRPVVVCYAARCVATRVRDAGPFGATDGRGWRIETSGRTRPPWSYRGGVDLSRALWARLGRPAFLSRVVLVWLEPDAQTKWRAVR